MIPQLPLQFEFHKSQTIDSFFVGPNREVIANLCHFVADGTEPYLYFWGATGAGKSHLIHSCCQLANSQKRNVLLLPMRDLVAMEPECLEGIADSELVCVDDVQLVSHSLDWELSFFNLFNQLRDNGHQLLVSANCPPTDLNYVLADLKTRMAWGLTLELKSFNDDERLAALISHAASLGMVISSDVGGYILARFPRDFCSLWQLLEKLNQASLAAQRKVTIPFLKSVLEQE